MQLRKVVLIHPGREGRIFGKATGSPYTLMRLASLVPEDISVEIWDENWEPLERKFHELGPNDLVGITSKTLAVERAREFAEMAHDAGVRVVVVGGVHATLMPEDVQPWADVVVTGEAYRTWPQLIQDFIDDSLKPRYDDTEWASLKNVAPISDRVIEMMNENRRYWTPMLEITRGCPRGCSFCTAIRVSGKKIRYRPIDEVVDEIKRRRLQRFFLTDDNFGLPFTTNPQYIEDLFKELAKLPLHGWTAQVEMSVAKRPDLLRLARKAHMDKMFIGFESINPANRKELGGKSNGVAEDDLKAVEAIHEAGLGVVGLFVFGFDEDTPQTIFDTWDFIKNSSLDSVSMTVLTPYPGTPFREVLIQEGRLMDKPWRFYDTAHLVYYPKRMSVEEFEKAYDYVCRKAYRYPAILRRGLGSLKRHALREWPSKFMGSFGTDYGYRLTYDWRYETGGRLLSAWKPSTRRAFA